MKTYKVSVERSFYETSFVSIEAESPDDAIEKVQKQINTDELFDIDVNWPGEKHYEPGSFRTTGDVDD